MDDNGLPPLPSAPNATPIVPESVVPAPADNETLPPLPVPSDTVKSSDTVTPTSPPPSPEATVEQAPVTPSPTEPEKPKKKSNMKVVAGLMVALFLIGSAITSLVMFPNFRGDIRPKARDIEEVEQYMEQQTQDTVQLQTQEIPYQEVTSAPQQSGGGEPPPGDHGAPDAGSGNNNSGGGGSPTCEGSVVSECNANGGWCVPDNGGGHCDFPPATTTTTAPTATSTNECSGAGTQCVGGYTQRCSNGEWYDTQQRCCTQDPVLCWDGTEVNGCWGVCPTRPTVTTTTNECSRPDETRCVGGYLELCSGGQFYSSQRPCGTGGQSGSCVQRGTTCVCNTCHRDGFQSRTGVMCNSDGTAFTGETCPMPDNGTGDRVQTCGCLNQGEAAPGETGPYHCWYKNGNTGAWISEIGETIPNKLGCKGSGAPSVTTTATATVTTTPGGGSSSGGSSSSSSGGSSSSSSGGTAPLCVETRVYLKKADGTFDTVATPVSQLSSKVSIGNTIRLAIRGNLANFTKGRFIIKKDGTVLETKETTTKNNLPGDPATFEYIYDYTVASGGSYSIEGAVWQ